LKKRVADGQAYDSIGDQIDQHGAACFAQSAQCSGADTLDGVEDLEDGGYGQQAGADGNGLAVMGVHVDEGLGNG
jgi:hypothetical protein